MSRGRLIALPSAPLRSAQGCRSLAGWVWQARAAAPAPLERRAAQLAKETPSPPGRVHDLGRFEDETSWLSLRSCLPEHFAAALRPPLEWYGCRGAGFHTDAHYSTVLFGAWYLAGPQRNLVFGDPALQLACATGELVVFDPFQPHAVLDSGQARYDRERYLAAPASVFLGFELELTGAIRRGFGIGPAEPDAFAVSSSTAVNAETGRIAR